MSTWPPPSFLTEKAELLHRDSEVQEDFIDATSPRRRWKNTKSDFLYVADEVGKVGRQLRAGGVYAEMARKLFITGAITESAAPRPSALCRWPCTTQPQASCRSMAISSSSLAGS